MAVQLSNPLYIVLKVILATALALLLDQWLGNPDHVSSTFVAVLCVSPTVLIGLRNAWAQVLGSLVGGIWGTLANLIAGPVTLMLPLAVGGAVASSFGLRIASGYPVAAFTALFMILVQWETPWLTFETRFLALFIAAVSSFVINVLVSSMLYRQIYAYRLEKVERYVFAVLPEVIQGNYTPADQGFELLSTLQEQLRQTLFELRLRRAGGQQQTLTQQLERTRQLNYFLHLIWDLACLRQEEQVELRELEAFIAWLQNPAGQAFVFLPDQLLGVQKRVVSVFKELQRL